MKFNISSKTVSGLMVFLALAMAFPAAAVAAGTNASQHATKKKGAKDGLPNPKDPLYWAKMRGIYAIQKRPFQKDGRLAVTIYGGLIPNNIFEQYLPIGIRLNYYILENIGLELSSSYAFTAPTNLKSIVTDSSGIKASNVLIGDVQLSHTTFGVVWSPFYGKMAFYRSAITYFDMYLFGGVGFVLTETTPTFNAAPQQDGKPEGALGGGIAFYMGQHAGIRVDFRQFVFQKVTGGVANPSEVSVGLSWFL